MSLQPVPEYSDVNKKLRSGTVNSGYEYEELVPAYFALKLLLDVNVKSFTIELNPSSYGKFDDVVITVKIYNNTEKFAIQLKHRVSGKDMVDAAHEFCRRDSKNKGKSFNISEYSEAYKNENHQVQEDYKFILFTNTIFDNLEQIRRYEVSTVTKPFKSQFLNLDKICQFKERQKRPTTKFYENFFLISGQANVDGMYDAIERIFVDKFKAESNVATSYIHFFKQVHNDKYNDTKITRDVTILNLARFLFSNCTITTPLTRHHNTNIELIEEVIKIFNVVIVSEIDKTFIKNYWKSICSNEEIKHLNDLSRDIKFLQKTKSLNDEQRIQLLPYLMEKPLFVEFSQENEQKIYFISTLLKTLTSFKIRLVLVGTKINRDNIDNNKFQGWKIFRDLKDLAPHETLYQKFTEMFKVSLQGREVVTISKLKNVFSIDKIITPSVVFSFLKSDVIFIGKRIKALPTVYIPRSLLRTDVSFETLRSVCRKSTIVVHCEGTLAEFNKCLEGKVTETPIINITDNNNIDVSLKTPVLILTDDLEIQDDHKQFNHLKFKHNTLQWMNNNPKIPSIFENDKSVVIGEPGIGKTTMMTYLAHNCPLNYWIIIVSLQQLNLLIKDHITTEQIIKQFLSNSVANKIYIRVTKKLLEKKQIIFFFDGLNELSSKHIKESLNIINKIAEQGFKVWIFGTKEIKTTTQTVLGEVCYYEIEDMVMEDQVKYINNRLMGANVNERTIKTVINKLFENDCSKKNEIFKLPLILYVLTESLILSDKNVSKLEEHLTLDQICTSLVEGILQHNLKKIGSQSVPVITDVFRNYYFNGYQIAALEICLESELFKSLNVKIPRNFFHHVKKNGDYLEFIRANDDNTFIFTHYIFAEYFAALWLSENLDEVSLKVKKSLLKPRYEGIRRFFDAYLAEDCPLHSAIIEQDLPKVKQLAEKCLNDVDKGGRTPLHLAVTYGVKHPLLSLEEVETEFNKPCSSDCKKQEEILKFLLSIVPKKMIDKEDNLFKWNPWEYADAALALFSLEELSKKEEIKWVYLQSYHQDTNSLSYYCVKMGYKNLLEVIIRNNVLSFQSKDRKRTLLGLALANDYSEIANLLLGLERDTQIRLYYKRTPKEEPINYRCFPGFDKLLVKKGDNEKNANFHRSNSQKKTSLERTVRRGNSKHSPKQLAETMGHSSAIQKFERS